MKRAIATFACTATLLAAVAIGTGCVSTVDGRSRAAVPFTKDKIVSKYERPAPQIIESTRKVLSTLGTITSDDIANNVVTASVNTRIVYVKVTQLDDKVSEVVTQVRTKGGGADIDLAAEVDKQIALGLR
jgi:hypothetical protein